MDKEKLQQDINEIKEKLSEMEAELQIKNKFEFVYEDGKTYFIGSYSTEVDYIVSKECVEYGRYRKTKQSAEKALLLQKEVMRLHSLVEQLDGENGNFFIFEQFGAWKTGKILYNDFYPGMVLMSEKCANEICRMLNVGEVEL